MPDLGQGDVKLLEQAAQAYDQVLAIDPRDPWTWHNKSVVLQQLGRYQEALDCNTRALEIMDFGTAQDMRKPFYATSTMRSSRTLDSKTDSNRTGQAWTLAHKRR